MPSTLPDFQIFPVPLQIKSISFQIKSVPLQINTVSFQVNSMPFQIKSVLFHTNHTKIRKRRTLSPVFRLRFGGCRACQRSWTRAELATQKSVVEMLVNWVTIVLIRLGACEEFPQFSQSILLGKPSSNGTFTIPHTVNKLVFLMFWKFGCMRVAISSLSSVSTRSRQSLMPTLNSSKVS